jgi:hypothetical protein
LGPVAPTVQLVMQLQVRILVIAVRDKFHYVLCTRINTY